MFADRPGFTLAGAAMLGAGAGFLLFLPLLHAKRAAAAKPETSVLLREERDPASAGLPAQSVSGDTVDTFPAQSYLLKLKEDTLYVYTEGSREASASYQVPAGLPDYDRILLEYGMKVSSESDLQRLLEDYVS